MQYFSISSIVGDISIRGTQMRKFLGIDYGRVNGDLTTEMTFELSDNGIVTLILTEQRPAITSDESKPDSFKEIL